MWPGTMAINLRNELPCAGPASYWTLLGGALSRKRSWLALITFCATAAMVVALALTVLLASVTVAFAVARTIRSASTSKPIAASKEDLSPGAIEEQPAGTAIDTFSGLVTDDHCGPRHDMGSAKTSAECTLACVRNGAKFSLVDGDKRYTLEGDSQEIEKVSGLRVTVQGSLQGDTITVHSIASQ